MSGQFFVEPVPGLVVEPEDEPEEPEEPEVPVLGLEVEPEPPEPELEVVVDVVAASATNAPPTTRPEVKAPMASALRICRCMVVAFRLVLHPPIGRATDTMSRQPWDARRMP
jgi:hypothetical protein